MKKQNWSYLYGCFYPGQRFFSTLFSTLMNFSGGMKPTTCFSASSLPRESNSTIAGGPKRWKRFRIALWSSLLAVTFACNSVITDNLERTSGAAKVNFSISLQLTHQSA